MRRDGSARQREVGPQLKDFAIGPKSSISGLQAQQNHYL
jgi:hypothetical protein